MSLTIGTQGASVGVVVAPCGEMDMATSPQVRRAIDQALATTDGGVTVDLAGLTFCDSSGISALLHGRREADAKGVPYRVINATGWVAQVLDAAGVMKFLAGDD
jgi:anti-sigma B factor antagonist